MTLLETVGTRALLRADRERIPRGGFGLAHGGTPARQGDKTQHREQ